MSSSSKTRDLALAGLQAATASAPLDVLIVGGGVTGAGLALEASSRGMRTGLVEKRDFAAGTSSRSTKLIHGGLRYLEHFDFGLVREGLRERAALFEIAPHLSNPIPFVIPIYDDRLRNYDRPIMVRAGLVLYDLLAGNYAIKRHHRIPPDEALRMAPQLDPRGLKGALVYYDGRTNDSRLVVEIIKTAQSLGAIVANYTRLTGFIRNSRGKVAGARVRDEVSGAEVNVHARRVINATGVWMNEIRNLAGSLAEHEKHLRPTKGIHLTVSAERLKVNTAWLVPAVGEHRFYFIVPWEGRVNIGTTDTDYDGEKDAPGAREVEVIQILQAVNAFFPTAALKREDVISAWAGLRPLVSSGNSNRSSTAVSRKEEIFEDRDGLISLAGGKLTTYRLMAERGINLAAKRLKEESGSRYQPSRSRHLALQGADIAADRIDSLAQGLAQASKLPLDIARHLLTSYGAEYPRLIDLIHDYEPLAARLVDDLPVIGAEVVFAVRNEMALTVADVMTRRTRLAILGGGMAAAAKVTDLMAREFEWNDSQSAQQLEAFEQEFRQEYLPR